MQRPFIPLTLALAAGIWTGSVIPIADVFLQLFLIATILLMVASFRKRVLRLSSTLLIVSLYTAGILGINANLAKKPGEISFTREEVSLGGMICENPEISSERTELVISPLHIMRDETIYPLRNRLLLSVNNLSYPCRYGDYIHFRTRIEEPHNFNNPGGFDHERYLRYRGITAQGSVNGVSDMAVIREDQGNRLKAYIEKYRTHLRNLVRTQAPSPEREIIQAMILGEQKGIPEDIRERFNRTGTSHIIAISGFNVGIIVFFSVFLIRYMLKSSEYLLLRFNIIKVATILSFLPVVTFTLIAGMGISVVRATIMAITFMVALLLGKDRDLYNILALAAFVILIVSPPSLFDVSFQLSFIAVAAILHLTPRLTHLVPDRAFTAGKLHHFILFLLATIAATLGTLPIIATCFNRVSTVILPANVVVVPILGIIAIPFCMAIIFSAPFSTALTIILIKISSFLVTISLGLVAFFADLPGSSVMTVTPNTMEIIAYYLVLVILAGLIDWWKQPSPRKRMGPWLIASLCILLFTLAGEGIWLFQRTIEGRLLKITAVDVGQGSATLVQFPGGKKMLIDGGGFAASSFDVGKYVLAPFLLHERIRHLDFVVLTHPHPDHLNGLIYIMKNFDVGEVWMTAQAIDTREYNIFIRSIRDKNIPCQVLLPRPKERRIGPVMVLTTVENGAVSSDNYAMLNDNSLVMKLTYGNTSVLMPADITGKTEASLLRSGTNLRSDVLFVPHHGGFQSSSVPFLNRVCPGTAIISCGKDNVFHDPHPDVLARYAARTVKILRTDRDGAIAITSDGNGIATNTFTRSRTANRTDSFSRING